jgi:hypothetical protein
MEPSTEHKKSQKRNERVITGVLDVERNSSYNDGLSRCVPALSLYASLIRDQKAAADTARPVRPLASGRARGSRFSDAGDSQHLNYRNYLNSNLWGSVLRRSQALSAVQCTARRRQAKRDQLRNGMRDFAMQT